MTLNSILNKVRSDKAVYKVKIIIKDPEVVSKSYNSFWSDLERIAIYSE